MKPFLFSLGLLAAVTTGDSYSKTEVTTQIEGEGQVYTRIEQEVNGEKQVLEANEPGTYKLEFGSPPQEMVVEASDSAEADQIPEPETVRQKTKSFLLRILQSIKSLLDKILPSR
ncbi:MAG: hypothetical protein UX85_C0005G0073 [Candidatus Beckwithbacteria bacterium GW2011_GWB1_47_15]|uniref:Uncharacterized protein n=1 Tax=Candidatus Beckwithbacteria bacterium GW2011_GWB1_47_15 TaxID=1618371 RepID=A0A0G1UTJ0_9BACT|nr:MAG: hypothetical protein UY43_C0001G0803 [Candidatus Beckwithbacteria bacterium GW2011_GWC1_49_16]KKU35781.1 MAG: hypothetical protein UX50_C0002G0208 [Candidatus Beckwithbacteria bacterium GW2011_GWA1_46_30]KKU61035.1 MAG: hypothetical protein UX85_C0005G0073 [Candidatus Beckwithbacteria bacterium GW2011_GWB1_47_15]KKU72340.1 MAG: hypothetical protein UX97_C0001G0210 [Candidatus Beckwithbacteria bacterium GW2011_GWA2_47_25]KKW04900.1 MAG: hypothetical protein UY37_C0001G0004 [Candidatus Be